MKQLPAKSTTKKDISTSVGVEPTNLACAPSTAASDVLNHYTINLSILFWGCLDGVMVKDVRRCSARRARRIVGSTTAEVEIFIWIMSPLWSKKTSVAATDERNIIILYRK